MLTDKDEIISTLNMAEELEKQGLKNYLDFARQTKDITGKDMFLLLARDEYDHMTIIQEQRDNIQHCGCWKKYENPHFNITKILPKTKDIEGYPPDEELLNQIHALDMALEFETRARDSYYLLAEKCDDPDVKKLFAFLSEMEQGHYDLLENQKASLTDNRTWLEMAEFSMEPLME